jgi:glycosyltransferase involved in cell wall biosynthesis
MMTDESENLPRGGETAGDAAGGATAGGATAGGQAAGAAFVAIDARAAVRPELGGVERWTRELARRLPALRPGAYRVLRPRPALAHRAGHAWEQVVLPARARHARALLCPANLTPLAAAHTVVVIHDAAPLRHPRWYSRTYATAQRLLLPAIARRAQRVVTVSEFARAEIAELLGVDAAVVPGGVDERFTPAAAAAAVPRNEPPPPPCGCIGPPLYGPPPPIGPPVGPPPHGEPPC